MPISYWVISIDINNVRSMLLWNLLYGEWLLYPFTSVQSLYIEYMSCFCNLSRPTGSSGNWSRYTWQPRVSAWIMITSFKSKLNNKIITNRRITTNEIATKLKGCWICDKDFLKIHISDWFFKLSKKGLTVYFLKRWESTTFFCIQATVHCLNVQRINPLPWPILS